MQCRFEVGQRVVLIDDAWFEKSKVELPTMGSIYQITEIFECTHPRVQLNGPQIWLRLRGFRDGFHHARFRPLDERDISIEQFERLLVDLPERVGERV